VVLPQNRGASRYALSCRRLVARAFPGGSPFETPEFSRLCPKS
jgi:hypothetical protein